MLELSIIIVNCNSTAYLRKCLASLRRNALGNEPEIFVIDNASMCDDPGQLVAEYPEVRLIRSEVNLGFARANNLGFEYSRGAYLLFLNPDTEIVGDAIGTMLARLRSLPDAGIMGCKLLNADGSVQTSCIQRFPTILNQALNIEYLRQRWPKLRLWGIAPLYSHPSQPVQVQVISGACLMIKRDVFEKVGKFCEDYFMYGEDADLCYRVREFGGKAFYTGEAMVTHYGGGSTNRKDANHWAAVMQRRAILQFLRRTRGPVAAAAYRATMTIAAAVRLVAFALLAPLRAHAAEKGLVCATAGKWIAVLKWAVGLDGKVVVSR